MSYSRQRELAILHSRQVVERIAAERLNILTCTAFESSLQEQARRVQCEWEALEDMELVTETGKPEED